MKKVKLLFILAVTTIVGHTAQAQIAPVDANGVAVGGYDVVSYFSGEAKRGFENFSAKHDGVTYYFYTKDNRATFQKSPEKYLPQFGGYCAWGVGAKTAKFPTDPETYDIVDGKLYLFFNAPFNGEQFNTVLDWNSRTTELKKAAHKNWPKVSMGK
ncbi:YHS domain-containing (seleno)protein [Flagellimonas sp. S3867]|uniref:YHS domain-containing (seleno)protein n=1 Tax=Flagellimonas sp. S3867 TaxID=2768063 RepID=UPI00168690ED|nr:YHS domain-containing (seleno)protein [Flagellimonas sp. S3867]